MLERKAWRNSTIVEGDNSVECKPEKNTALPERSCQTDKMKLGH